MTTTQQSARSRLGNKVPEVTVSFWVIKVLCTIVGETFADNLNQQLSLGLTNTSLIMGALLVSCLTLQFRTRRYLPAVSWLTVVLISVVGTLITDNLTDNLGVSLITTTVIFSIVLALVYGGWFASERTLSIHSIFTPRRESWYWLAILFTFALGTAAGDLTAEKLAVGYWRSALLFAGLIAVITALHSVLTARAPTSNARHTTNAVLAFWLADILARPLGASIGDYLSQAESDGGLALGTLVTSAIFLGAILVLVGYLTITHTDDITEQSICEMVQTPEHTGVPQLRS